MAEKAYKRRNYFIKKGFQLRYTLFVLFVIVLAVTATGVGIYLGMWASIIENFSEFRVSENLETARRIADYEGVRYKKGDYRLERIFREAELLSAEQRESLKSALEAVNRSLVPKITVLMLVIFLAGIFLSHKIAGPMYRFERSAEAIKEGDLRSGFKIRKGDEMKKTASVLDEMTENLRGDIERIKIAKEKLAKTLVDVSDKDKPRITIIIKEIDGILSKYKT